MSLVEGPTSEAIISESRFIMERIYTNNENLLKAKGKFRAEQWRWLKEHGIKYTEKSYMDWNPDKKNKRIIGIPTILIAALAVYHAKSIESICYGEY